MWLGVATGYRAHQASDARARRLRSQPQRRVFIGTSPIDSRERLLLEEHPHSLAAARKATRASRSSPARASRAAEL